MDRRFAPNFCFLLLWVALANGALVKTGGQAHQLQKPSLKSADSLKSNSRIKRSLNDGDEQRLNSGEGNGELLKLFSRDLPAKVTEKRDTNSNIDSITERDGISGNLYPEAAIHNLEQISDKVESDMQYRRSKIPTRMEDGRLAEDTRDTRVGDKAVYNIGQEASLEIPLTTKIDQPRIEELTKRDIIPHEQRSRSVSEGKEGSRLISDSNVGSINGDQGGSSIVNNDKSGSSEAKLGGTSGAMKTTQTRRNEVPLLGSSFLRNSLDDAADEDFQVRDKSADLEIHADSSGVRVKAKPASLQVVSNPHGDVKTLPGETHSEGVVAERRTFTPVLPAEKRAHHHLHGLGPRPLTHLPFLRHHHYFHRRHRLPWLRHRQHINYPDVFERMRFNSMPEGPSPFGGMGPPLAMSPPMVSMMGSPPPMMGSPPPSMMSEGPGMSLMGGGGMGGGGMGGGGMGGGMGGPLIPQLLQRSPTMETNPANRFGVPESPMPAMGRMSPMGDMSPMVKMGSMGEMSAMGRMGLMADMSPVSRMNAMGEAPSMGRMGSMGEMSPMGGMSPMGRMGPMESMMGPMSPGSPFGQSEMRRKDAMEFWGLPNQDQIRALARGENVQKVLGSNRYGESLGGITPGGMNPGMGGASFNANGMGENMMGPFGGSSNSMFHGMSGGPSNMMGMRRNMLYKKDSIDKTDAYKKSMKLKQSSDRKTEPAVTSDDAVSGTTRSGHEKFEEGIMKKAQSLVAGEKHVAKNEESELRREHRIKKSSKLEEKRSLDDKQSKKTSKKHQKVKDVKGSKKDIAVNRPPIIYHPPPEVFHRPDIVLHRPPVLFHRPPIVYHQAPVVVHRPAVVYRQSPIIFHQPSPVVSQPYYRAWDNFQMSPAYAHVGSHVAQAYNYMGVPPAVTGYRKGVVPHKPKAVGEKTKGEEKKETKRTEVPEHKEDKKSSVDKNEKVAQKKKKDVVVNRPPIIYHPPPEVYHRPEIVVHRAPLLIKRPPIIYHQPAVIVHRPPVVYHQPPLIFHQPAPTVNQPVLYSHDNFVVHPSFFATHHGSIVSDAGRLLGIPNTVSVPDGIGFPFDPAGANPGLAPGGLGMPGGMGMPPMSPMGRRKRSLHHRRKKAKHVNAKRKNAVMVKRPPIVYHPPPEVYHRPDIVVHRAPLIVHRSPIIYHQAPVIVHRPAVVYHQPPVLFHQPPPMVAQPTFASHDMYSPHHSLTLVGSTAPTPALSNVAVVANKAAQKSSIKKRKKSNSKKKSQTEKVSRKHGVKSDSKKHSKKNRIRNHKSREDGSKKGHISRAKESKASKKNAVLVKRPPIVYHPPPEVYHRPDIVVHRAPLVIHRSPIIYHQAPVVVHRPAVVYHQPPVLFHQPPPVVNQPVMTAHDVYHEASTLTHSSSSLTPQGAYLGVPSEVMTHPTTAYGKSKVPRKKKHQQKHRRDVKQEKSSKKNAIANKDVTEKASKKNAVLVKRPPIIYHPPPEVYHRPDIVVHRAPIVIHRAPLVYHQAPVIVHRPAVVYHQPAVVFHQPPPMVHQPMFTSHDTFTPHDTLTLGASTTQKVGDFEGPPPETYATRKGEVPKNVKGTSRNTIPEESKDKKDKPHLHISKDKGEYLHQKSMKSKGDKHSQRRSHLRKLILSLQKDRDHAKKGLQIAAGSPLVLQRPPLILSRPAVMAPGVGHSLLAPPMAHPFIQRVIQPVPVYQPVIRQVPVPVLRPVPVPVVYHHHHWPVHFHHNHIQPVMMQPPHYTSFSYHPYNTFGKSHVPRSKKDKSEVPGSSQQKDTIHVHDFGVPAHGHVGRVNGNSHVVTHHGYVTRHADCPQHCGTCKPPNCPSDCKPHCVAIIHHQHHRPQHIFLHHQHHHNIAQTHFHNHHWPVHHHDVYHNHPYFPHRHIGHPVHTYPPYHHLGRRDTDSNESTSHDGMQKTTVPHYKVYQHVKHWHPPCIHNGHTCHHHHHPMTIYHDHHHPTSVVHHHHYTPYPVYHHHEHIKPVIYHHLKPYPVHHHHEHHVHDSWHHDHHHHHVLPPTPYPVPVSIPTPIEVPVPITAPVPVPVLQPPCIGRPPFCGNSHHVLGRSNVPHSVPKETKKSETGVPDKSTKKSETSKTKNKKKDVVVNRPPIIYHPPPEVYHRPEIVVHRAPVLVHRPPIVYHQPAVIVHRPPVVYHQSPVIFHQPAPTVNQPVLYSHDNFVVHPTMLATHAGTMVESAGHFLGMPSGPISNFPDSLSPYGGPQGFGTAPYATPFGRKRRSTNENAKEGKESSQRENDSSQKIDKKSEKVEISGKSHNSKKADRKNAIVVHRPPVVYHPPPEIYHRPRVVVHRPDVLIHRPPIVYHQSPVVLHRPPVVYHQAPLVFHQPPPMINQPVYHSHDTYAPHPVYTHYDSDVHHVGAYQGVPPYGGDYHGGGYHDFGGFHGIGGVFSGFHGGFGGYPGLHGGIGGYHGGFGGFHGSFTSGFGRSKIEKPNRKKHKKAKSHKKSSAKSEKAHRKHSVMVHRPPVIFHPPPEIYHRPAYVLHQPDIVIHRPDTVYHQSPVVVHHPPVAYHQHPVVYHQPPPVIVQPTYHHHQFFTQCGGHGCYGGGFGHGGFGHGGFGYGGFGHGGFGHGGFGHGGFGHSGCSWEGCGPHLYGGFGHGGFGHGGFGHGGFGHGGFGHGGCSGHGCFGGGFGHGGLGGGFHGGYPFLYGKSSVPKDDNSKKHGKTSSEHKTTSDGSEGSKHHKHGDADTKRKPSSQDAEGSKRRHKAVKESKGSKKNDIVINRPPLIYHPPPEIYHRPDVVVHRPDVLVHRPSVVYDQPAVVLHRPAVVYHEPDVVFHQPPPLVNLPVYHASDLYAPHPVYEHTDSQVEYDNDIHGVPPHFSFGPYGVSHAFGKSKIEGGDDKTEKKSEDKKTEKDSGSVEKNENTELDSGTKTVIDNKHSEKPSVTKDSEKKSHHSGKHASHHTKEKSRTAKAHKKYHLIMHRPPIIYHSSPTIYHRPDVVVHHPDIVIHRPSVVVQPPSVVVHKPAVVYHQPPVVFHQPEPAIHQPVYHSHDSYEAHPVYTHVGSHVEHGEEYLAHPAMDYPHYGFHDYGDAHEFPGFGKSKIQETEEKHEKEHAKEEHDEPEHDNDERVEKKQHEKEQHKDEKHEKRQHKHTKRDTQSTNTKRVQLPHTQKEKTVTGTKKNAIVVKRPPIIYHPPPEVYHRPDIVVHRAPIVIQRAPLVYHQSPVIVHRPAVVYHQPAVVFHQPAPAVHQPVFHSVDTFSVHPHLSFTQAGSSVHQRGEYVGIPQELMHRSTVPTSSPHPSNAQHTDSHPKERRATIVQDIAPVTPLNFIHPRHPRFETPRSTIPYPTLHPHSLSYASFPWGYSPKTKRSVEGHPYATMVPHELFPLPYSPFYHPTPLQRPHVNVNIETVKSNVPKRENRERRQSILDPTQPHGPIAMQPGLDEMHSGQMTSYPGIGPYPNLPRPHVNVNVETLKSAVPRNKRQVLAGFPAQAVQPNLPPPTYSQAVVPAQLPSPPELGVYRDLLGAIYPRGVRRRPKVNIVVQTAKSNIPTAQNVKKSVLPSSLNKNNVDAFNTMPEVTTIEPPLLRDGVRVNMVDLGDPTSGPNPAHRSNFAPKLQPSYGNTNLQNYGANILGLGAQGNFGMDKWKKSAISEPSTSWRDVNAQKKSSVPSAHQAAGGKKRFMIDGFQSPGQYPKYQSGLEAQGSLPLAQPAFAGHAVPQGSISQIAATAGIASPAGYAPEPQGYSPQTSGATEQAQPEPAIAESQASGIEQPGRPHVNVNVETIKKHTVNSNSLPSKRQLIGTLPLTSLFRPNPNTAKASLKSMVPNRIPKPETNSAQPVTKRQQIMGRVPLAQAIPQLRNRVTSRRVSPASSTRGYAAFPVRDTQPQIPRSFPYQGVQPASRQEVFTPPITPPIAQPITPPIPAESFVNPSPLILPPPPSLHPALYPWGGQRPRVNINIQTAKSNIPAKSQKAKKIITPRFKREFPVLYNIIKAKAESDATKKDGRSRRDRRQIPMFPGGGFLQRLIPDPSLLAKRAFYGALPRYPINPAVLVPRASRPRPEKEPMGTIEVGGSNAESLVPNAASLLKNEFSQSFDDIAKIQRQEVNAIKGMNMGNQAPSPSVLNMPEQAPPNAQVVSLPGQGAAPGLVSEPAATASAVPVQRQAQQPQMAPISSQQTMATFAAAPQALSAAGQPLPAQLSTQAPVEIAPGFVRGKPEPFMLGQAAQAREPAFQATAPAVQAPEPSIGAPESAVSKKSPFTVMDPEQLPPGFQPQFAMPGMQFPFFPPAELAPQPGFAPQEGIPQALPYPRPFFNPIPQPEPDDSDRPSVNIQVQTSKSKIPKLQGKKKDTKDNKKKTH